ncbi:right-handed parallel beta-helix repeat-containing protein [Paenibacillus sp. TRM 82003]|uniref:right-handed parallel beta-helix repeat-containing protein n=1 Tax=Kineococcus sp. TRM81007 TaxID=2925831 RepID=UPI001F57930F|nr:right-handed parallel beta-helix repeat-containing protein [Kineococcus sp. TRM81007]MCI2239872.1 right-handed parallel beta-helix repeat-containing protein [Kineococcus sp. TRM81007]MCI3925824.1 right-handed parallel beta-helix repeat-containing protein [Paenibacillus sp. TRM 82003]
MAGTKRTWKAVVAAVGTSVVLAASTLPAQAASSSPWIAYSGTSVNNARVPATTVALTTRSPKAFDTLTYLVAGEAVSATVAAAPPATANGDWTATADVDLSAFSGRISLTARMVSGRSSSSVAKTLRVVDPAAGLGAGGSTSGGAVDVQRPSRKVRAQVTDGRPGPLTTGLRGKGTQRTLTGDQTITRDGTVLDGVRIVGCVVVDADDVVIRNSEVVCRKKGRQVAVKVAEGKRNLLIEDSEIDATGADVGVGWGHYTLRRVNLHGSADGARFGHDVVIEDSWIHGMTRVEGLHSDAVQTTSGSNVVVRGNVLDPSNGKDPLNAAVMIGTELGTRKLSNVLIEGNRLGGGSYTINVRGDASITGLVVRGNTFEDNSRYGAMIMPNGKDITVSGNVLGWTGQEVTGDRW